MPDSIEYLREIEALLIETSRRTIFSWSGDESHPFEKSATAGNASISLQTKNDGNHNGYSTSKNALRLRAMDGVGAGTGARVDAVFELAPKLYLSTKRLRLFVQFKNETALADYHDLEFHLTYFDNTNAHRAAVKFDSNLGVTDAYAYYNSSAGWTALTVPNFTTFNVSAFHTVEFTVDFDDETYKDITIDGEAVASVNYAVDETASVPGAPMFSIEIRWNVDGDSIEHDCFVDRVILTEVDV